MSCHDCEVSVRDLTLRSGEFLKEGLQRLRAVFRAAQSRFGILCPFELLSCDLGGEANDHIAGDFFGIGFVDRPVVQIIEIEPVVHSESEHRVGKMDRRFCSLRPQNGVDIALCGFDQKLMGTHVGIYRRQFPDGGCAP